MFFDLLTLLPPYKNKNITPKTENPTPYQHLYRLHTSTKAFFLKIRQKIADIIIKTTIYSYDQKNGIQHYFPK